jgi:folate-binding protein YgfZ
MSAVISHRFRPSTVLRAHGEDAASFLQGQFSQDLRPWATGRVSYGLWLTLKGKVLGDSWVLQVGERDFLLLSIDTPAATLRERLERFVIADDVSFSDETADWNGAAVMGDGAAAALARCALELPPPGRAGCGEGARTLVFAGRRGAPSWEVWWRGDGADPLGGLAATEVDGADIERRRIAAGIPRVPLDIGPADLPQEGGLEREAVSFDKGCYLGQEVMARIHAMGQVRRSLVRVRGAGAPPAPLPRSLWREGRTVGEVRSAVPAAEGGGWIGLALVQRAASAGPWSFRADGEPAVHPWPTAMP